jgi:uncharacterized peroxidase-related enzyme
MTWVKTIPRSEAGPELVRALDAYQGLYPKEYAQPVHPTLEGAPGIVASHSLIPDALLHAFSTFGVLMSPDLPLSRAQHEMIATRVSALNSCNFCAISHEEFLRRVTLDAEQARAIRFDYEKAPLSPADRAMLDYVGKVTQKAYTVTEEDHEILRRHGFDDRARLQITLIAAFFNYINRVADALGVGQRG